MTNEPEGSYHSSYFTVSKMNLTGKADKVFAELRELSKKYPDMTVAEFERMTKVDEALICQQREINQLRVRVHQLEVWSGKF